MTGRVDPGIPAASCLGPRQPVAVLRSLSWVPPALAQVSEPCENRICWSRPLLGRSGSLVRVTRWPEPSVKESVTETRASLAGGTDEGIQGNEWRPGGRTPDSPWSIDSFATSLFDGLVQVSTTCHSLIGNCVWLLTRIRHSSGPGRPACFSHHAYTARRRASSDRRSPRTEYTRAVATAANVPAPANQSLRGP
jgi:hypothetical protein